jgi:hypothetical protein
MAAGRTVLSSLATGTSHLPHFVDWAEMTLLARVPVSFNSIRTLAFRPSDLRIFAIRIADFSRSENWQRLGLKASL